MWMEYKRQISCKLIPKFFVERKFRILEKQVVETTSWKGFTGKY